MSHATDQQFIQNLSLGALGKAVGANSDTTSETKLAEDCGLVTSGDSPVSMHNFTCTGVTLATSGDISPMSIGFANISYPNQQAQFVQRVLINQNNWGWSLSGEADSHMNIIFSNVYIAMVMGTPGPGGLNTVLNLVPGTVSYKFEDGYNLSATNHGVALDFTSDVEYYGPAGSAD